MSRGRHPAVIRRTGGPASGTGWVDRRVDVHLAARAFVGPLLTYVLLDGLLRRAGDIRSPAERAIARQVALFHRSISPDHQPEGESP